jgi:phosphoglycolate phosphatase/AHBA synthesis associated protein
VKRPAGLLFDLDGVLVDSYEVWFRVQNDLSRELGRPPIPRDAFRAGWGQGIEEDVRAYYPDSTVTEVEAFYDRRFPEHLEHLAVMAGAAELFDALRARACPTCVITNTPAPLARRMLGRAGIVAGAVVGGTDVPAPKPAPDMVLRGAELLGMDVARVAVVGDSRYDREAACAAGAMFIGFRIDSDRRVDRLEEVLDLLAP